MLNYSIMLLSENHIDEICADIVEQVKSGVATMPLFKMTLTPEGVPAIDKAALLTESYKKFKEKLDAAGVPSGVLIQASIGHGWKLNQPSAFQKYVGLTTGKPVEVCCPYDENFREYIKRSAATIASANPDHIMLDDDFRLMARSELGCVCPLHMARFNRLAGASLTDRELHSAFWGEEMHGTELKKKYREAFIQTQIDSLVGCAKEIRAGIDSVNPAIPGSFCLCGDSAEGAFEIASIMAGEGNPITLRVNNANYCAKDPRDFVNIMHHAATQKAALGGKPNVILAETDTCPQNRYSTPAAKLHSHFTFSILEGAKGAKHWITRLFDHEPNSGKEYRKKLAKYNGFYNELSSITDDLVWQGCKIPVPAHSIPVVAKGDMNPAVANGWCGNVLDRLGLPLHFSVDGEGACFFDSMRDLAFTTEELKGFLAGNVVLDAVAAERFIKRGLGEYIGVDVKVREPGSKNTSGEQFPDGSISKAMYGARELVPLSEDVKVCSEVYFLKDGVEREMLFPGVTSYKNSLGGCAVVFSGDTKFNYNIVDAFGFLCEARKRQLAHILTDLGCLPAYYPDDAEVLFKAAKMPDGRLLCALLDMSLDVLDEIPLCVNRDVNGIKRLCPDGTYADVKFSRDGDSNKYTLSLAAGVFDPVILIVE
ncbi:MAG: hypothetical protein IJX74_06135 [Clostridia bacterium]|nr:hypothetical protein [Clostridia bacterium]